MTTSKRSTSRSISSNAKLLIISPALLRRMPLPQPDKDGDKEDRGRVLVVGGAPEMPGAIILAATAALRAGAGKLQIATCRSIAPLVAAAVPEARVFALAETKTGAISASAAAEIAERANQVQALLIGPGMIDEDAVGRLMRSVIKQVEKPTVILDAAALSFLADSPVSLRALRGRAVLTPHAGEMSKMSKENEKSIKDEPQRVLREAVKDFDAVIALKGRETLIAAPGSRVYCNRAGNVGLATSGSGDTLSGVIVGLAARGATPLQATVWGVYLHACAGDRLARRIGQLGFLARELLAEVPVVMSELNRRRNKR